MVKRGKLPSTMSGDDPGPDDLPELQPLAEKHRSRVVPDARKADRPLTKNVGCALDLETYQRVRDHSIRAKESISAMCRRGLLAILAESGEGRAES